MMDCPWCDDPIVVDAAADDVACDGCGVRVAFAPDPAPVITLEIAA
jgi:hypothetical protein